MRGQLIQSGTPRQEVLAAVRRLRILTKLSSSATAAPASLALLRAAFPHAPIAYVVREPAACLASLLAAPSRIELLDVPCLRWRGRARQLPGLLQLSGTADPLDLTAEAYCAAHLGSLLQTMLSRIRADRGETAVTTTDAGSNGRLSSGHVASRPPSEHVESLVIDHSELADASHGSQPGGGGGVLDRLLRLFGLENETDEAARRRMLEAGAANAKAPA